jgi:TonB family protein
MLRSLIVSLTAATCVGCAPSDGAMYSGSDGVMRTRAEAEKAITREIRLEHGPDLPFDRPLRAIHVPFPPYPEQLQAARIVGRVRTTFTIEHDGSVSDVRTEGAADPALVAMVLDAVARWRFEPITREGKPLRIRATQDFVFRPK